jgi:hypothetical protein
VKQFDSVEYETRIGNRSDALALLDQLIEEADDTAVAALEALRDAIAREIV